MALAGEGLMEEDPQRIYLLSEGKLHRGYRDGSGRFTLEQCNLSKANEANNLREFAEFEARPDDWDSHERCEYCF